VVIVGIEAYSPSLGALGAKLERQTRCTPPTSNSTAPSTCTHATEGIEVVCLMGGWPDLPRICPVFSVGVNSFRLVPIKWVGWVRGCQNGDPKAVWYYDKPRGEGKLGNALRNAAEELPKSVLSEYIGDEARADGTFRITNYSMRHTAITNLFSAGFTPEQVCKVRSCYTSVLFICDYCFVLVRALHFCSSCYGTCCYCPCSYYYLYD
jgi:hypothetical protein